MLTTRKEERRECIVAREEGTVRNSDGADIQERTKKRGKKIMKESPGQYSRTSDSHKKSYPSIMNVGRRGKGRKDTKGAHRRGKKSVRELALENNNLAKKES